MHTFLSLTLNAIELNSITFFPGGWRTVFLLSTFNEPTLNGKFTKMKCVCVESVHTHEYLNGQKIEWHITENVELNYF